MNDRTSEVELLLIPTTSYRDCSSVGGQDFRLIPESTTVRRILCSWVRRRVCVMIACSVGNSRNLNRVIQLTRPLGCHQLATVFFLINLVRIF